MQQKCCQVIPTSSGLRLTGQATPLWTRNSLLKQNWKKSSCIKSTRCGICFEFYGTTNTSGIKKITANVLILIKTIHFTNFLCHVMSYYNWTWYLLITSSVTFSHVRVIWCQINVFKFKRLAFKFFDLLLILKGVLGMETLTKGVNPPRDTTGTM